LDYAHKGRLGGGYCHVVTVKWTKAAVKSIVANKPRYAKAAMRLRLNEDRKVKDRCLAGVVLKPKAEPEVTEEEPN